ncbi:MAG TPA: hypothetical protein VIQ31_32720 [Phormidium sp.]
MSKINRDGEEENETRSTRGTERKGDSQPDPNRSRKAGRTSEGTGIVEKRSCRATTKTRRGITSTRSRDAITGGMLRGLISQARQQVKFLQGQIKQWETLLEEMERRINENARNEEE